MLYNLAANWNRELYILFPLPYWMTNNQLHSSKQTVLSSYSREYRVRCTPAGTANIWIAPKGLNQTRRVWIKCVAEQLLIYIDVDCDSFVGLAHHRNFKITIGWTWFRPWCATSSFRNSVSTASWLICEGGGLEHSFIGNADLEV